MSSKSVRYVVPSSAISQRPAMVFPSSPEDAVKRWENGSP
jgi:hypothetical protein